MQFNLKPISAVLLLVVLCVCFTAACTSEPTEQTVLDEQTQAEPEAVVQVAEPTKAEAAPTEEVAPTAVPATEAPPTATRNPAIVLPVLGEAPNITNEVWLNSEPITLEDLRGKVVLVEFWTFG